MMVYKQKCFTLIELIIVVSIIVIMAVLAVPAFDRYGARNELDGKAEEIKTFIETAYKQAQSPQKGANGSEIIISNAPITLVSSSQRSFNSTCFADILVAGCGGETSSSSVQMPNYFHLNISGGNLILDFKTPVSKDTDSCFTTCDPMVSITTFELTSERVSGETRTITINRNPFNVSVTSP